MYAKTFRRLGREIIPVLAFSVAAFLSAALMRYAFVPQWQGLRALRAERTYYKSLVSDTNRYQAIKTLLLQKKERLNRKYDSMIAGYGSMPSDLPVLLQMLINRAKEADIRFARMQPQQEIRRQAQVECPVILETTTSYHALGRLVSSLEEMPQLLSIDRLAITAQKRGIDVRILVTCFLKKTE